MSEVISTSDCQIELYSGLLNWLKKLDFSDYYEES